MITKKSSVLAVGYLADIFSSVGLFFMLSFHKVIQLSNYLKIAQHFLSYLVIYFLTKLGIFGEKNKRKSRGS